MQQGIYTFYNCSTGRYLSHEGKTLVLKRSPQPWMLEPAGENLFYVYAHNTQLLLDIDNAWVAEGNTVKIWEHTGYDVQIWTIGENPNGTYSLLYSGDNRYCLGFDGENAVLQLRRKENPMQQWKLTDITASVTKEYLSVVSNGKVVELQLPPDITKVISVAQLHCWADRLEIAYGTFCQLTGFTPYPNIFVEAYKPNNYPEYVGWAFPQSNEIHINRKFIFDILTKMQLHKDDWCFCALHEMGHMFDFEKPWNFEPELMTDLKVAYVLEKHNACAAMDVSGSTTCFYGADIARAYALYAAPFSEEYDIFGCVKRFLEIKDEIGWEPFRQTFHYLQTYSGNFAGLSRPEKLELFAGMLTRYSGQDIKAYFTAPQWAAILRHIAP